MNMPGKAFAQPSAATVLPATPLAALLAREVRQLLKKADQKSRPSLQDRPFRNFSHVVAHSFTQSPGL
jgi:hypothetical protein